MNKLLNLQICRIGLDTLDKIDRVFYICSYTGCGTMLLTNAIRKQRKLVKIIHDKNIPTKLEFVGNDAIQITDTNMPPFKFNGIKIPDEFTNKFTVIYIYKNPINSIYSRLYRKGFSQYISSTSEEISFDEVIEKEQDLYGLEEFFDNYTTVDNNRNYKIICVNYEHLFEKQNELSEFLGLEPLNLIKMETIHEQKNYDILIKIYQNLIDKFKTLNPFITVI